MDIATKIRKIKEFKEFSQEYMAEHMQLSQKAYSNMELGHTKISTERLQKIAGIFNISVSDILSFDEKQTFNKCSQSGNTHTIINESFEHERKAYLLQIAHLEKEVKYLRKMLINSKKQNRST